MKEVSLFTNKYHFDHIRLCCLHLPYEQPDSQALLRLFSHSLPSWKNCNRYYRLIPISLDLFYQDDFEAIIGKNFRHFDVRIFFAINQFDKKKIFICAGITINDFVGWFFVLPFRLLLSTVQPLIIRNMKMQSLSDMT